MSDLDIADTVAAVIEGGDLIINTEESRMRNLHCFTRMSVYRL